jgi:hypothetical protein
MTTPVKIPMPATNQLTRMATQWASATFFLFRSLLKKPSQGASISRTNHPNNATRDRTNAQFFVFFSRPLGHYFGT